MKALTAISDVSLIAVGGPGIVGLPDVVGRTFSTTAGVRANVLLISQSSSQNDICFVVSSADAKRPSKPCASNSRKTSPTKVDHITLDPISPSSLSSVKTCAAPSGWPAAPSTSSAARM